MPRFEQKLKGSEPSEDSLCETSMCSEEGLLQIHSLTKDTECSSKVVIRQITSPTPECPLNESESLLLESETLQSQRVNENCNMSLGCDVIRVNETTRGKHLEPSNSVETQFSCNSRVHETTLGGTLSMVEYRDASCCDSSYYDAEEGRQQTETGSAYVRNTELLNIDCLAPENIRPEQEQQPEIHMIKQWKSENKRPT